MSKRCSKTPPSRPRGAEPWNSDPLRRLHPADVDRHADRLLPRRRQLCDGGLYGPAAAGGIPAAEFRHERVFAARHPLLHLRRRPDGARRHRPAHRRLRRLARWPCARWPRPGEYRHRDALRRHFRFGGRRSGGRRRADDPADEGSRLRRGLCRQRHLDGRADRTASAAFAQHDHLFDLCRRQDFHRRPVHRRHHSRAAAGRLAHGHRLFRRSQARLSDGTLSRLRDGGAAFRHRDPRIASHRNHLRRCPLRHLHRYRKLLRRGASTRFW